MMECFFCLAIIEEANDYCPVYFCPNCGATICADEFECQPMSDDFRINVIGGIFLFLSGKFLLIK